MNNENVMQKDDVNKKIEDMIVLLNNRLDKIERILYGLAQKDNVE